MSPKSAHVECPPLGDLEKCVWIGDIPGLGARLHPDRDALIFAERGQHQTYAQLNSLSNGFAALLCQRGIRAGDRIAYLGKNSDLFYLVLFGAIRAHAVVVAINWRLAVPEVRFQVADSESRLLICDADLMPLAEQAVRGLPHVPALLVTEGDGGLRQILAPAPATGSTPTRNDIILQLYTSGTTGRPKGVLLSHEALSIARHAELMSADFAHVRHGCISLSAMPNFHIGGMSWVLIGLVRLGTVVITADASVANMLKLIRQYSVEHSWMVPTLIRGLVDGLRHDPRNVPRFSGMFYGAMPMDEALLRESLELFGCSFLQFFGMTEAGGSATALAPRDHDLSRPHLLRSVGRPYPGVSVEIRDPERRLLACGEPGEIWIKSPTVMCGYWNLPERTAESLVDGWYASGDGGYLDEEGYLYLTDRIKDMIVTGGENVYPVEVEQALRLHPDIVEAAVVGVPDPRWGERVVAVLELRPNRAPAVESLITFCRQHLADYKCPKRMEFTATLPRTASGKVQRAVVRQDLLRRNVN
jgi:acyl-CoA synthetase (AMP-forming)/AMP-acid ligase II